MRLSISPISEVKHFSVILFDGFIVLFSFSGQIVHHFQVPIHSKNISDTFFFSFTRSSPVEKSTSDRSLVFQMVVIDEIESVFATL